MNESTVWEIVKNYLEINTLVHTQISSFNEYILQGIPEVIGNEPDITVENNDSIYNVQFGNVFVGKPSIIKERNSHVVYPSEIRNKDMNYEASIYCDITEKTTSTYDGSEKVVHHSMQSIGTTPIMLNSIRCNLKSLSREQRIEMNECEYDLGGYFIIKGNERVIVPQLRENHNNVIVLKKENDKNKSSEKYYSYVASLRSMSEQTAHSCKIKVMITQNDLGVKCNIPKIVSDIPVGIVLKAYGVKHDEISSFIGIDNSDKYIRIIERDYSMMDTEEDALDYIGKLLKNLSTKDKRILFAKQLISTEMFPHMGIVSTLKEKIVFFSMIIRKLILTCRGVRQTDDRDHYKNKRIETCGILCTELFRTLFKKTVNTLKLKLEKQKNFNVIPLIGKCNKITKGLMHCFKTGKWGAPKSMYIRPGVSQVLNRMTYGATISHMRSFVFPIGKESKSSHLRQIHSSQFGYVCPSETPEGQKVGLVLNFSLLTSVSSKTPTILMKDIIERNPLVTSISKAENENLSNYSNVFINGIVVGLTDEPDELVEDIISLRRRQIIHRDISIVYNIIDNEVLVFCDGGRFIRPLFKVDDNHIEWKKTNGTSWDRLVDDNIIEYIDCSEIESYVIAMDKSDLKKHLCDYLEIHPSLLLGVMGSIIPFPEHSPSPRNCYQCSMGKQALGIPAMSYRHRNDTALHVLDYPQKPLVSTKAAELMRFNEMPSGINAIVAIMTYTGYNQEDSVIINQSAIDRGLFNVSSYKTITEQESRTKANITESICVPPYSVGNKGEKGYFKRKNANYSFLNDNGIVRKGSHVSIGDIIIGKISIQQLKNQDEVVTDVSVQISSGYEGIVDRVYSEIDPNGYRIVKVIIRKHRHAEVGDKFASRSAQKGTVGITYRQEDMPFTMEGIVPDIIINPHAIPSRMTVNQLMECVLGKSCVINGTFGDSTPFSENSKNIAEKLGNLLSEAGMNHYNSYNRNGWENMYNGFSGEPIKAQVFIGPTYYQRLKHMVSDKLHARAEGQVTTLTRQPLEGRSRDGGLRFGEMERDCMISHGTAAFLKDRLFDCSDSYQVPLCDKCGMITSSSDKCDSCMSDNVNVCNLPYASKLLTHQLIAMGIKVEMRS